MSNCPAAVKCNRKYIFEPTWGDPHGFCSLLWRGMFSGCPSNKSSQLHHFPRFVRAHISSARTETPPPPRATSRLSGVKPNKSHGQPQAVTLAPSYPRQIYTPGHILKEAPDNDGPPNLRFDGTVIWLRKCLVRPRSNLSPPTFDEKAGLGAPSVRFALSRHSSSASRPRSS
jgi:hypothetical protein